MRGSLALIGGVVSLLAANPAAAAAVDYFLQIDGIQGASASHPGAIELNSFSWGAGRPVAGPSEADRESSTPSVSDIVITRKTDSASPKLWQACVSGQHFPTVTLNLPSPSGGANGGRTYTLSNVVISSDKPTGEANPTETLTLHFTKISWTVAGATGPALTPATTTVSSNPWAPH